ncbi:MAG TPA: PilZ domain-containing protein, partial [Pyrinomonadaceae bacterium]
MTQERRKAERVQAHHPVHWEDLFARHEGTISDISTTGCFILTGDSVKHGELIFVEISLPQMLSMNIQGEVVNQARDIGFGM